jgi:hypothetical protein
MNAVVGAPPLSNEYIPFKGIYTFSRIFECALHVYNNLDWEQPKLLKRKEYSDNTVPVRKVQANFLLILHDIPPLIMCMLPEPIQLYYNYCMEDRFNEGDGIFDGSVKRCRFCGSPHDLTKVAGSLYCRDHLKKNQKCDTCEQMYPRGWFAKNSKTHFGCEYGTYKDFECKATVPDGEPNLCYTCLKMTKPKDLKVGKTNLCRQCHTITERAINAWNKGEGLNRPLRKECPRCRTKKLVEEFNPSKRTLDHRTKVCTDCLGGTEVTERAFYEQWLRERGLPDDIIERRLIQYDKHHKED